MALKQYKPDTSSRRGLVLVDRSGLWTGKPHKALVEGKPKSGGRNNTGRLTGHRKGGGHKQRYRIVDFKRQKFDVPAKVERLEYDPNRTAFIALIKYNDGEMAYILAPQRLKEGDTVVSSMETAVDVAPGNTAPLKNLPVGTIIHNVEMKPKKGGQIARAGGSYAQLVGRDQGYAQIRLASGELRRIPGECLATIGAVSNPDQKNISLAKAGRSRWLGRKPAVRGVAMNPHDHPHGGGEGKTSGGRHPVSPWGQPTKGYRTRNKKKPSDSMIIRKRYNSK